MSEKLGLFDKTKIFFGEVRTEMKKVVWPTRDQVRTYTIVVIVATAMLAILLGIWDLGLTHAVRLVLGLGGETPDA